MKSGELANEVIGVCLDAAGRVTGVGHESYAAGDDRQRFEQETLKDELQGLEEELLDTINWAAMSILKIRARMKALDL